MKILVTGANGYLGKGIVNFLDKRDVSVVATDVQFEDFINPNVEIFPANLFAIEDPYSYFGKPDIVLHLAWSDGFKHFSNRHLEELPMHVGFIERIANSGIKKICVMGSMHEVGFYEGSINENTPCNPQSYYGIAKNALREATLLITEKYKKQMQWLRGFYIVSADRNGSSVFSKLSQAAFEGKKEFPFTLGMNQFDFLDYDDFCKYVSIIVLQDKIDGIINVCCGRPEKLSDRVERFIQDNSFNIRLDYGVYPDRPYDSKAVWGDATKITRILEKGI